MRLIHMKTLALAGIVALAVVVATIAVPWWMSRAETASARTVADRARAVQSELVANLGPDTTLHAVGATYKPGKIPPGPFVLPERVRGEWWLYFDATGAPAGYRSEAYDAATGEMVQTGALVDGKFVITDTLSGQSRIFAFDTNAADIVQQLAQAQIEVATLVAPDADAASGRVGGTETYVLDIAAGNGIRRSYIDKATYREVKWEILDSGGNVIESKETPVLEVLPGRAGALAR